MSSVPMPKPARAAVVVAFLIAILCVLNLRSGPIMLLGVSLAAVLSAVGMLQRRAWSAWGVTMLLALSIVAMLVFAITGQSPASFLQMLVGVVLYAGLAALFLLAGHMLSLTGARRGTPIPWILIAAAFSLPFVFFKQIPVPSNAMDDTLLIGDFVLVDRFSNARPADGDVVAFRFPGHKNLILIRRIAGLPGDRIHLASGILYRNGVAVNEPYVTHNQTPSSGGLADITVPPNKCFVLGDARAESLDSRQWGFVDLADIIGKPRFIYDSLAPDPADIKPAEPITGDKFQAQPGPLLRRWDRVFKPL